MKFFDRRNVHGTSVDIWSVSALNDVELWSR